ncbi:MAG: flagellar motor switch protein FliM [Candidatus Scalinduaceae bacterium]
MADINNTILSSEEVESLLESFHEGQLPIEQTEVVDEGGMIKYYDFRRPNTISREKKRMLYKLYEGTAYHMGRGVSNYLRSTVKVSLDSIDELSFEIFKNTCPELLFVNTIRLRPLQGLGCITMDLGLCLSFVEKAFGASGRSENAIRKLTDIEIKILGNIISIMLEKFKSAWEPFMSMDWRSFENITETRYLNIASETEVVLLVSFTVSLDYSFGEMKLCVPVSSMSSVLERMSDSERPDDSKGRNKANAEILGKLVKELKLVMAGILDETNIAVDDLINLKEGDVIKLDSKISDDIKIAVEGKNKFYGKLGLLGKKKATQISTLINK